MRRERRDAVFKQWTDCLTKLRCQHAVLQFAVEVLKVEHIIVCGHYDCGGIRAALEPRDAGTVGLWLSHVRDVHRLHSEQLRGITNGEVCFLLLPR